MTLTFVIDGERGFGPEDWKVGTRRSSKLGNVCIKALRMSCRSGKLAGWEIRSYSGALLSPETLLEDSGLPDGARLFLTRPAYLSG